MLLASGVTALLTTGLALYDYLAKKNHRTQDDPRDKKRTFQSIKILLTGGPYHHPYLDAEEKVRASTAFTIHLEASLLLFLLYLKLQPSLELQVLLLIFPNSNQGRSSCFKFT